MRVNTLQCNNVDVEISLTHTITLIFSFTLYSVVARRGRLAPTYNSNCLKAVTGHKTSEYHLCLHLGGCILFW